jgi:hypothetical protein
MYRSVIITDPMTGDSVEHIFRDIPGGVQSFPNVDDNDGPERQAYLAWLAEGNEPTIVEP